MDQNLFNRNVGIIIVLTLKISQSSVQLVSQSVGTNMLIFFYT